MLFKNKTYQITTNLSEQEVFKILNDNTEEKRIRFSKSKYEFEGIVYKDHFNLMKTISGRNSFNPQIIGHFNTNDNKTIIVYNLELNSFVSIFFIVWISIVALFFIISLFQIITNGIHNFLPLISIPMLFFGFILYFIATKMSEDKITETFEKLFQEKVQEVI